MSIQETITGLQHVGIPTDNLDATIAFYKDLGFETAGIFPNGANQCAFLKRDNLTIETWTGDQTVKETGAINHLSLNSTNIEETFAAAKAMDLQLVDQSIQSIPSFWDNGIRYFNILGPNNETIEFCEIL